MARYYRGELTGRADAPLEVLDDGSVGVFLTIGYMQTILRQMGAPKVGEDFAATIINTILPRLGLIEPTPFVKKPHVEEAHPGEPRKNGGRHAQPSSIRSYWWRVFRLPSLGALLSPRAGAYSSRPGWPVPRLRGSASLVGLLRRQGLISARARASRYAHGSVQAAFQATGPP